MRLSVGYPVGNVSDLDAATITRDVTLDGDLHVTGDVIIDGAGGAVINGGIAVDRAPAENTELVWDEGTDAWMIKFDTSLDQTICVRSSAIVEGGIPFGNAVSGYTHDAAKLFWDNTNKRLGIGTNAPVGELHMNQPNASTPLNFAMEVLDNTSDINIAFMRGGMQQGGIIYDLHATGATHKMKFQVDNGDKIVVLGSGYVGFGVAAPNCKVHALDNTDAAIIKADGNSGNVIIKAYDKGYVGTDSALKISFGANSAENIRVSATGNVGINKDSTIPLDVSGVVGTDGIKFPASQVASADVNTLDDYEEGTFQPTLGFSSGIQGAFTYTQQDGYYTKIGNIVHISIIMAWSAIPTGGSNLQLYGLPFAPAVRTATGKMFHVVNTGTWDTVSPDSMYIGNAELLGTIYRHGTGTANFYNYNHIPSEATMIISLFYRV